tara:strand:+ start:365 stop:796 length:432 start_codon:yes stop_codon:yes gene_type:complete
MTLTEEKMIKIAKQKLGLEVTDSFDDSCDLYCYTETTVDGYEVWVLTHSTRNVNVCENVYYYDSDLASSIMNELGYGETLLHIDDDTWNDLYMDDQMLEYFAESVEDIIEDNDEEGYGLTKAEIQELKDEHGLEAEEFEETVS